MLPTGCWTGTCLFSNYEPCHRKMPVVQHSARFKGNFWTLGLPREVGRQSSINWTSHRSDYGLMTYLPFCKVKFLEKLYVITPTLPFLNSGLAQESTMPVLPKQVMVELKVTASFTHKMYVLNIIQGIYKQQTFTSTLKLLPAFKKPAQSSDLASQFLAKLSILEVSVTGNKSTELAANQSFSFSQNIQLW